MTTSSQTYEAIKLEPAFELMRQAIERCDLVELQHLINSPKILPPWTHSKDFPASRAACLRQLETSDMHPLSLALNPVNLDAFRLLIPSASPWALSTALEKAADTTHHEAFDLALDAIPFAPTPKGGWPKSSGAGGAHYGRGDAEKIAIYPFGFALEIAVARGFSHGVRRLAERVKDDDWTPADRLMSYRCVSVGVSHLPRSFDALRALLPALPIKSVKTDLRHEALCRKRDRFRGHTPGAEADEAFAALLAFAEGLEIASGSQDIIDATARATAKPPRL